MKPIHLPINDLKLALAGFTKVIPRRANLPVLTSLRINRDHSGAISLQATDLDSFATYKLPVLYTSNEPAEFLVPLEPLTKAAKGAKDEVVLYQEDKESVIIQTKVSNTPVEQKVATIALKEWPAAPEMGLATLSLDEKFKDTFNEALQCASDDESRYILNGVCLDVEDKKGHYVVSTNGRFLFSANSFHFNLEESVIIPTHKFLKWSGWWTEPSMNMAVRKGVKAVKPEEVDKPGWLKFSSGPWTFITKQVDGNYPNWKQVMPKEGFKTVIRIPDDAIPTILEVLNRIPGDYEPNYPVVLNATKSGLVLQGQNKDQKEPALVPIAGAHIEGEEISICLNRHYLAKGLKFGLTEIHLIDDTSSLLLKNGGKQMVIMPVRFEGNPPNRSTPPPAPELSEAPPTAPAAQPIQQTPAQPTQTASEATTPEAKERKEMTIANNNTQTSQEHPTEAPESPLKSTLQKLDSIKDSLRQVFGDLGEAVASLKQAEREKKATDKEVEMVREKLREIQSVTI